eukprot:gb/GEZN01007146.1/.p1 GENE.gb/GEZN01007146.1/~~gb/GEZN01007146.1/.p1  ORF type:complete len:332 (+),score=37.90 gb/GEZN01007146.1/:161-1156(+)
MALKGRGLDSQGQPQGVSAVTISGYVSAVRSLCVGLGLPISSFSDARVRRVMRAIKRLRSRARRSRLPIIIPLATRMLQLLPLGPSSSLLVVMLAAVITTGIYGLLRSGEMVAKPHSASAPLRRCHVTWDAASPSMWVDLFIEASKTDICREGATTVRLHRNDTITCPVSNLWRAWVAAPNKLMSASLFQSEDGSPLSYSWLQSSLRDLISALGLDPALYGTHSLRIGGATSLAMLGNVSVDVIKHIGRWKSLSYQLYVRVTDDAVRQASSALGSFSNKCVRGSASRGGSVQAACPDWSGLFGGLPLDSVVRWSTDDIDTIAVRFKGQGGA